MSTSVTGMQSLGVKDDSKIAEKSPRRCQLDAVGALLHLRISRMSSRRSSESTMISTGGGLKAHSPTSAMVAHEYMPCSLQHISRLAMRCVQKALDHSYCACILIHPIQRPCTGNRRGTLRPPLQELQVELPHRQGPGGPGTSQRDILV